MAYKTSTENSIKDNNLKLTADKIILNLDQLREEGKKSRRRWIWELMQNAKDVENKYGKVTINIELNDHEFAFTHNGDPFSINNITSLIQQVSSKPSDSSKAEITGKFGTGFIATHLLSDVIFVKGIVKEVGETPKRFNLKLDRSGETSEELMPVIGESLKEISQIDNDDLFPIAPNYEEQRKEVDLDNVFSYPIFEENKSTAIDAIEDLLKTLPLTMAFNDKIKKVSINNAIKNTHYTYLCQTEKKDNGISHARISIINEYDKIEKEHFYIIKSQNEPNFDLAIKVDGFAKPTLIVNEESSPFLYRDFPLIGSNKFYFPFILNGKSLHPTDRRDGILLIGNTKKTTHNRAILQAAIQESVNFVDYLIDHEACNLFVTALSSLPDYNFDEDEDFECKDWYIENIQKYYRKELIDKHLYSKDRTLSEIKFPYDEMAKSKLDTLRDVCAPIFGIGCIPEKSEYEIWLNFIGPYEEKDTWGVQLYVDIENILKLLQENKKLEQIILLPTEIGEPPVERLTWLNSFYQFLIDVYGKIPDNYEIVPNENNIFKKFSTLFIEEPNAILPDAFLDVLKKIGEDWKEFMLKRGIIIQDEGHIVRDMKMLTQSINDKIGKQTNINGVVHHDFLNRVDALEILLDIHQITTYGATGESIQASLLLKACNLFHQDRTPIIEERAKDFYFITANRVLITMINRKIASLSKIESLAEELKVNSQETIKWLNSYLVALKRNSELSKYLEFHKIIPNRTGGFCHYSELYNFGNESQRLDDKLINVLTKIEHTENWQSILVADGIDIRFEKTKSFEELGTAIINKVSDIDIHNNHGVFRESLLELVEWVNNNESLTQMYAKSLPELSSKVFYVLTVKDVSTRKAIMKILKSPEQLSALSKIAESGVDLADIATLVELFPEGIPKNIMDYAKEDARKKKEFSNLLDVGSKVERLLIGALSQFEVTNEIIHAGGGAYDIRIYNPDTKKSYYIELKSCHFQNSDPINIAVSQVKRAVKELNNGMFCIVIIERSQNNEMDSDYIKSNTKYLRNPGQYLGVIANNFDVIEKSANTNDVVDLKMSNAEFKGTLDYDWILDKIGNAGFDELIEDINKILQNEM